MIRVGITGGIGSGKSYVCQKLQQLGYPIYDCDREAKRLMREDECIRRELTKLIGPEAYTADDIDRAVVADYLFRSAEHAAKVNAIVHPRVKADFLQWTDRQTAPLVFLESAILFESKFDSIVDSVLLVTAPLSLRLRRAMMRDHVSEQQIRSRMQQQSSDSILRQQADHVIENDGTTDLDSRLNEIIQQIIQETIFQKEKQPC